MKVDNFELIKSLLQFESKDNFYFCQILKRKKDNNNVTNGHSNADRIIRSYHIDSIDYFDKIKEEIIKLCDSVNARAYINLTKRSYHKCALLAMEEMFRRYRQGNYHSLFHIANSVCGSKDSMLKPRRWIIDIDTKELEIVKKYEDVVKESHIITLPTLNGYHIITSPFNRAEYSEDFKGIEIHMNNPTLLYYKKI